MTNIVNKIHAIDSNITNELLIQLGEDIPTKARVKKELMSAFYGNKDITNEEVSYGYNLYHTDEDGYFYIDDSNDLMEELQHLEFLLAQAEGAYDEWKEAVKCGGVEYNSDTQIFLGSECQEALTALKLFKISNDLMSKDTVVHAYFCKETFEDDYGMYCDYLKQFYYGSHLEIAPISEDKYKSLISPTFLMMLEQSEYGFEINRELTHEDDAKDKEHLLKRIETKMSKLESELDMLQSRL